MSLDNSETTLHESQEPLTADLEQDAKPSKPKKKMPTVFKVMIGITLVFLFIMIGLISYLLLNANKKPTNSLLGNTPSPAFTVDPSTDSQVNDGQAGADATVQGKAAGRLSLSVPKNEQQALEVTPKGDNANTESVGETGGDAYLPEVQFGNLTDEDIAKMIDEVKQSQATSKQEFEAYKKLTTDLHQLHNTQLQSLDEGQKRHEEALLDFKKELVALRSVVEKFETEAGGLKELNDKLGAYEQRLFAVEEQAEKNNKNIKWISYTRLCAAEKSLGLTRWAKYCGYDAEDVATTNKAPTRVAPKPLAIPVQAAPVISNSEPSEVPMTVGVSATAAPTANVIHINGQPQRAQNPCAYADRTWKISLIAQSQALLHRNSDGFKTMVDQHTSIPGLGRAQLFNSATYPQYVQFTNGIVCGG